MTGLIEDGKLMPVIDRTYPLAETAEGLRIVEQGHARGKIVVTVALRSAGAGGCVPRPGCVQPERPPPKIHGAGERAVSRRRPGGPQ